MSCGVGRRRGLDLALLWIWHRLADTPLIRPLAWEPPYAAGAALEKAKKTKNKKINKIKLKFKNVLKQQNAECLPCCKI